MDKPTVILKQLKPSDQGIGQENEDNWKEIENLQQRSLQTNKHCKQTNKKVLKCKKCD